MTSQEERARAETVLRSICTASNGPGDDDEMIAAGHALTAMLALAAEVLEDAAKVAEECVISLPGIGYGLADGASLARTQIAAAIRAQGGGQ